VSEKMIAQRQAGFVRQRKPAEETPLISLGPPWWQIREKFGDRYRTVRDYYLPRKESVVIQDVSPFVPRLVAAIEAAEAEEG